VKNAEGWKDSFKEGSEVLGDDDFEGDLKDAALIAAAQRVEHCEIGGYGTVHTFANWLEDDEVLAPLGQTLDEEKETDQKLTEIAGNVNLDAQGHSEENAEEKSPARLSKAATRKKSAT
jgi:ferritin-like metal-binding protein YciE